MIINTGYKGFGRLRERNITTGQLTGVNKVNVDTDPDYIAPVYDPAYCEEGELYITPSATTFNITSAASSVNINIVSNTTWQGTNNPFNITFPFGNTGTHDGVLTASITSNTGESSKTSSFLLKSTDNSVSITINIIQQAPTPPPSTLKTHNLTRSYKSFDPCNGAGGTYYLNGTFTSSTKIYTNSAGTSYAPTAYYSDGTYSRYWNGSSWGGSATLCGGGVAPR